MIETVKESLRRLRYLFTRGRRSRELEDEMAFHREMHQRTTGQDSTASEFSRHFGNELRLREQAREAWGWTWFDRLLQDLRYACRMLARSPGFTITSILILAIGIGVNVSAFSLFNLAVLKPLPVRDPESLVRLERRSPEIINGHMPYIAAMFLRDHSKSLSATMLIMGERIEFENDAAPVRTNFVSANLFAELGANPAYGRLFNLQDQAADAPLVVVLGNNFWMNHFGGDPSIVGKIVHLNHKQVTVIGIEPYSFPSLDGASADIWLPITQQPLLIDGSTALTDGSNGAPTMWGRLSPGITRQMAAAELLNITNERRKVDPKNVWKDEFIRVDPGGHQAIFNAQMYEAAAVVGVLTLLILAVACANLGGLLMARGVVREHELSIRIAIGASRSRIFRQLFTESFLLALLGSIAGLAIAYVGLRIILTTTDAPTWMTAAPDWRVFLFVLGMALITSLFFGFAPAMQLARQSRRKTRARQILICAQVGASCVLIIIASLLVRAVQYALYTNPGFGYEQVISVSPGLGDHGYKSASAQTYLQRLLERVKSLPGVTSVSLVKLPPLGHGVTRMDTEINGRPLVIFPNSIDSEFFPTMGIPILLGRNFAPGDKHVVIVSQSMAQRQWPGESPLGKKYGDQDTVIGVVGNARINDLNEDDTVELYFPIQLEEMPELSLILKTSGVPDGLTPQIKSIAQNLDPKLFPEISLLKANFRKEMKSIELGALTVSFIGFMAIILAGIGLLGLVAFTISQRTKEIAIRLALGASRGKVISVVLAQFAWPVMTGLALGAGITAATSQILRRVLYGISNLDPISYIIAIAILIVIIVCAALLPTRKAIKLDVARALHQD